MHQGEVVLGPVGLAGIPSISELFRSRATALAAYEDGLITVQHLSALETVETIERARSAGVHVTW